MVVSNPEDSLCATLVPLLSISIDSRYPLGTPLTSTAPLRLYESLQVVRCTNFMGQYWKLFNLDKVEYSENNGSKFGEFFFNNKERFWLNLLLSGQPDCEYWGGDRIILLGDYCKALPPNTVKEDDSDVLKKCTDSDNEEGAYSILLENGTHIGRIWCASDRLPEDTVFVLRNLDKKEYVRRDVLQSYRPYTARHSKIPGLHQALYTLVGWSEDPGAATAYNTDNFKPASGGTTVPLHRGAWAGNRIDIVALTDEVQKTFEEEGWTDISEEKARHVSDVCACDGW